MPSRPAAEQLEDRCLLDVGSLAASFVGPIRTIDGTNNNLANPQWGSTNEQLVRNAPAEYGDGISTPAGANRPNPRAISNRIAIHERDAAGVQEEVLNNRQMSNYSYVWGQFLDHDLDLTEPPTSGQEPLNIPLPPNDPLRPGVTQIPFNRSRFDPATGTGPGNPRQQINQITAWVDASMVYGSDAATARSLRTGTNGTGAKLRTTTTVVRDEEGNFLRREVLLPTDANGFFLAGDVRSNENIELTSMHVLFVREHNRLVDRMRAANPSLNNEQLYQRARAIVGAEIQVVTYKQWLPSLLGNNALRPYSGYNPSVNAGIANEFSTASFRLHTLINDDIEFFDNEGQEAFEGITLAEGFANPNKVREVGADVIIKYVASATAEEVDNQIVDSLRNFLFDPPGLFDLAAINIQRGRDHGLADYNAVRVAYGLPAVTSFDQISSDPEVQEALRQLYGSVNNIDLWVGGLAENHVPGSSFGPTIRAVMADQFERLRDGDRFWYQRIFSGALLAELENTTLADIIERNTVMDNLQDNVFFMRADVGGTVFFDRDGDGNQDDSDFGIPGVLVQLIVEEEGAVEVIGETRTDFAGRYRFSTEITETGEFTVRVVVPSFVQVTTENPQEFLVTRGGDEVIRGLDFGLRLANSGTAEPGAEFADVLTALMS